MGTKGTKQGQGHWGPHSISACNHKHHIWPRASCYTSHYLSLLPTPTPAKLPASTRRLLLLVCFILPCSSGHIPSSHQHMWPNFSYSLECQKQLLSSQHSCSAHRKQEESYDWTLLGNKWPRVFSLLLTGAPETEISLSGPRNVTISICTLPHTGHKAALSLWRSKYFTNVCEVPSRVPIPSWRILLYATAMLSDRQTCLLH